MVPTPAVILCVDDEANPLELRKLVLQKAGYRVITANSGREALEILASHSVDLVLSDHLMPGITGAERAQQIKDLRLQVPVVLLSGVNEIPAGAEAATVFLSKVEGPEKLCRQIAIVLDAAAK